MTLELKQLLKAMPGCTQARAATMLGPMNKAMDRVEINTKARKAMFIAQVGHESMNLVYMQEIASGAAYEGRMDLGNTRPGDGKKFKGRGPIQLTGRNNYTAFAAWSGLDCVNHPELLEIPENGWLASAWFWMVNGLNKWADLGDIDGASDVINKGHKTKAIGDANGFADRQARYKIAMNALP